MPNPVFSLQANITPPENFGFITFVAPLLYGFLIGSAIPLTAILITKLRNGVFPASVFLIGGEITKYSFLEKIQWSIVIAFAMSLAAGLVVAVLQYTWT